MKVMFCRRDTQHEQVLRFASKADAAQAIEHNERVMVYYPLSAGLFVRPMVQQSHQTFWTNALTILEVRP